MLRETPIPLMEGINRVKFVRKRKEENSLHGEEQIHIETNMSKIHSTRISHFKFQAKNFFVHQSIN